MQVATEIATRVIIKDAANLNWSKNYSSALLSAGIRNSD